MSEREVVVRRVRGPKGIVRVTYDRDARIGCFRGGQGPVKVAGDLSWVLQMARQYGRPEVVK